MTPDRLAFEDGLREAKRRLSVAGMHDGKCPEPKRPCTCGLDEAIDTEAIDSRATPVFGVDREPIGHRWPDELPPPVHYLLPDGYCEECGGGCLIGFGNP